MEEITVFWYRRDLRLHDNTALLAALESDSRVLPIFIFDKNILEDLPKNDARVHFIHNQLQAINTELEKHGSGLAMYFGTPTEVFQSLLKDYKVGKVFTNRDYEPYAQDRDAEIASLLSKQNIAFHTYKDQVIFEKDEVTKKDNSPYLVYTPYMKTWRQLFSSEMLSEKNIKPHYTNFFKSKKLPKLSLKEIGFIASEVKFPKAHLSEETIDNYEKTRNFPALHATSLLGVHLRFGTLSIREVVRQAVDAANDTFLKELIWREFFMQILFHFPNTVYESFHKKYDNIKWRNNEAEFLKWKNGKTGYPLVDAGMRQINETGFMHNRVRMLVASFLCKHLLIDWRWGEAYFAEKLLDYELASNVGNWQWAAGTGVDAAPYFRIFNPTTQIEKFDKNYEYIKKWVPEFGTPSYPEQIVDHKEARERCLVAYKAVV